MKTETYSTGEAYNPAEMAERWQKRWLEERVFVAPQPSERPRFFAYDYPPFPSGSLHMGHVRNYTIGDTLTRYKRLRGYDALYVQAFDSLGLPVEDAAVASGKTPAAWLDQCIADMTRELLRLGLSYDPTRFFSYHEPSYYRWTQWIFLQLHAAGAIYQARTWTDWCPKCRTALAHEQVYDGCCWRCGAEATKEQQANWFVDVQAIAGDLLRGLDKYDFPDKAKVLQRNWIGRRSGLFVSVPVEGRGRALDVFTTRVAVIHGATFLALAPEHPAVEDLLSAEADVEAKRDLVREMCTLPRVERMKAPERAGLRLACHAIHPLTGERIPVAVAPYVQIDLGTGAVLGCPAHDKNAHRFAATMGLPVVAVVEPEDGTETEGVLPYTGEGRLVSSGAFDGMETRAAEEAIAAELVRAGAACHGETYHVRDWCISRPRYWSAPIPVIHCETCGAVPVPEADLPVVLPTEGVDMSVGGNPLARHAPFVAASCPSCGAQARRETDTLDTFFNSAWSYMRYCNPGIEEAMCDREAVARWVPCDFDIGGTENILVANFYFRIILNWLHRLGLSTESEPFRSSIFHGMVLKDGLKMSKSLGNIVQPAQLIERYGVDAVRFQSMWAARPVNDYNWSDDRASASRHFLGGVWHTSLEILEALGGAAADDFDAAGMTNFEKKFESNLNFGISKVEKAYETLELQAACNNLMLLWEKIRKFWDRAKSRPTAANRALIRRAVLDFLVMLNPIAPHLTEELWSRFGQGAMLAQAAHWTDLSHEHHERFSGRNHLHQPTSC